MLLIATAEQKVSTKNERKHLASLLLREFNLLESPVCIQSASIHRSWILSKRVNIIASYNVLGKSSSGIPARKMRSFSLFRTKFELPPQQ